MSCVKAYFAFFMSEVRAKKHLGQHFLTDKSIAEKIADVLHPRQD